MNFRHLKYFVTVADEQNFTRAAEKLHISQPPLSRQIQDLEDELGLPLFERGARPLKLTEPGRFFYDHARRMLEQAEQAVRATKRIAQIERRLVIGFVGSTMYGALPRLVRLFRSACANTELTLLEMNTVEQIEALKQGRIDVGFGRIRLDEPGVRRELLRNERLVVAIPKEHELANSSKPVGLREVARHDNLIYPRSPRPSYADQVLSLFRDLGVEPAHILEVQELQTALGLVAAGMGLCVVPAGVNRLRPEDVVYRPIKEPQAVSPIIMSTRAHDQNPDIALMRGLIDDIYREMGWPVRAEAGQAPTMNVAAGIQEGGDAFERPKRGALRE